MSKVLKWILYVLLGLVVLAVVVGIFFVIFNGGHSYYMMRPGFRMIQPYRFNDFYLGRMIFGGLFALGLFLLVIIGIVALVSFIIRGNRPAQPPPANQMTSASQEPIPAAMPATTRTCSNCGKPAQEDWKTCPYCGNPLS